LGAGPFAFRVPKTLEAAEINSKENSMNLNQLTIVGFTGQDAEFHLTSNGTPVTSMSVATKESWKNAAGEWQNRTHWHTVGAFGKLL
jgi:single stranded DNA-binding protein